MESTELVKKSDSSADEFWRKHIIAAKRFAGTNSRYCREHDLNRKTFSSYKTKLGLSRKGKRRKALLRSAFVEVKQATADRKTSGMQLAPLPDAKWCAEFIMGLLRGLR